MLLRIDEVLTLDLENVNWVPYIRMFYFIYLLLQLLNYLSPGDHFDLTLHERKNAQTGVSHFYPLWANDKCPELCPLRALLRLDLLYKKLNVLTGPLFLHITAQGQIEVNHRMVC